MLLNIYKKLTKEEFNSHCELINSDLKLKYNYSKICILFKEIKFATLLLIRELNFLRKYFLISVDFEVDNFCSQNVNKLGNLIMVNFVLQFNPSP